MTFKQLFYFLLALLCLPFALYGCGEEVFDGLRVEVLDVGQSDCTLITRGDAVCMIDTGTATERNTVQNALEDRGIDRIDCLLLTHPHEDHIGNARMLLETYAVGALILSPVESDDWGYQLVLDAAKQAGVPCQTAQVGDCFSVGEAVLEVLYVGNDPADPNNSSVIARVIYQETVFLFTGDAESVEEGALLDAIPAERLDCDFLKAGHHGSENSTGARLLAAATPTHVAVSCGKNNSYGFPDVALLQRLSEADVLWHRTDEEGTLCYVSDGRTVRFVT
ncbi:MAG: MBL fold metallo-hydrolase [Clostridia bacterium]|nr:MBL fold metallo-hydrolase [Clostridia bacterium]